MAVIPNEVIFMPKNACGKVRDGGRAGKTLIPGEKGPFAPVRPQPPPRARGETWEGGRGGTGWLPPGLAESQKGLRGWGSPVRQSLVLLGPGSN